MKYTFLLPAYKTDYLRQSIKSILDQTYKDFTIYVSDDCSPYDIKSVVNSFNDRRIVYNRNKENIGGENLVAHWNKILDYCTSEFVIMASDDDLYSPFFLEEINNLVIKYPEINIFRSRVQNIDKDGIVFKKETIYEELSTQLEYVSQYYYTNHIQCIGNYVFKTKAIKENGGFHYFPLAWYSDFVTTVELSHNGIVNTNKILFSFRLSGKNISSSTRSDKKISKLKLKAVFEYDLWINTFFTKLNKTSLNKLDANTLLFIESEHRDDFIGNVLHYAHIISIKEMFNFIVKYKSYFKTKISLFLFLKRWFYKRYKLNK